MIIRVDSVTPSNDDRTRSAAPIDVADREAGGVGGDDDDDDDDSAPLEKNSPIVPGESNIMIVVRARPASHREQMAGAREVIKVIDGKMLVLADPTAPTGDFLRAGRSRERSYAFDHAFDEDCSQRLIYERSTRFLIEGVSSGYNATVFAYGATGAGKTYTMTGTEHDPGVMILAMQDLFAHIRRQHRRSLFKVTLSYLEVYNENLRDLFHPSASTNLHLREDPVKGIQVAGITELAAETPDEVMELLRRGNANRTTEPTAANQTSSRSHAVLQIYVEQRDRAAGTIEAVRVGKLSLIDLAGSERASITKNRGIRMIEGANINRSLLALGNCINALGSNSTFVPFRDSKLTRMLKDSLGGNTRTVMITNISKSDLSFEDTHNTLKYASRAKTIRTNVRRNVLEVSHHVAKYAQIIGELRREISSLKCQMRVSSLIHRRRDSRPMLDQLDQEHWMSARDMTSWVDARTKLQAIFEERKGIADDITRTIIANLVSQRDVLDHKSGSLLDDRVAKPAARSLVQGKRHVFCMKEKDLELCTREKKLREEIGFAGVNASQTVSQVIDLEMAMHSLRVTNMQLEQGKRIQVELDRSHDDRLARLETQIRLRDRLIDEQEKVLKQHNVDWVDDETLRESLIDLDDLFRRFKPEIGILAAPGIPAIATRVEIELAKEGEDAAVPADPHVPAKPVVLPKEQPNVEFNARLAPAVVLPRVVKEKPAPTGNPPMAASRRQSLPGHSPARPMRSGHSGFLPAPRELNTTSMHASRPPRKPGALFKYGFGSRSSIPASAVTSKNKQLGESMQRRNSRKQLFGAKAPAPRASAAVAAAEALLSIQSAKSTSKSLSLSSSRVSSQTNLRTSVDGQKDLSNFALYHTRILREKYIADGDGPAHHRQHTTTPTVEIHQ